MSDFDKDLAMEIIDWSRKVGGLDGGPMNFDRVTFENCGPHHAKAARIVRKHMGVSVVDSIMYSYNFLRCLTSSEEMTGRWSVSQQNSAITSFQKSAREMAASLEELNWSIRSELMAPEEFHKLIEVLRTAQKRVGSAREVANSGISKGRTNWKAVGVAFVCTAIWETIEKERAPKSENAGAPGPFGRFLEDVLECFGIASSARSALRAMPDYPPDQLSWIFVPPGNAPRD